MTPFSFILPDSRMFPMPFFTSLRENHIIYTYKYNVKNITSTVPNFFYYMVS